MQYHSQHVHAARAGVHVMDTAAVSWKSQRICALSNDFTNMFYHAFKRTVGPYAWHLQVFPDLEEHAQPHDHDNLMWLYIDVGRG
jgi:hypothetical protein